MKFNKSNITVGGAIHIIQNGEMINLPLSGLNKSKSGVYCIRNKFNGKIYIGMARNLESRMKRHWNDLRKGIHCSELMQRDCMELHSSCEAIYDPEEIFEFEVIIYCRPSELTFYENILINSLHPEYNTKKIKE